MTEQEIIEYLKENKNKGVAYLFMPEDVWDWIGENFNDPKLLYLASDGKWGFFHQTNFDDYDNVVFALPDDYEIKKESKGEWVEFEIDENGSYRILDTDMLFHWSEWNKPLWIYEKDENRSWYLTAFGGWQYDDGSKFLTTWYMQPMVFSAEGNRPVNFCLCNEQEKGKPAIPVKIRFWREK